MAPMDHSDEIQLHDSIPIRRDWKSLGLCWVSIGLLFVLVLFLCNLLQMSLFDSLWR